MIFQLHIGIYLLSSLVLTTTYLMVAHSYIPLFTFCFWAVVLNPSCSVKMLVLGFIGMLVTGHLAGFALTSYALNVSMLAILAYSAHAVVALSPLWRIIIAFFLTLFCQPVLMDLIHVLP